jgi:hypothetical protein
MFVGGALLLTYIVYKIIKSKWNYQQNFG